MKFPIITAHTGCMNTEWNTICSVETGIKAGADIIEVDVRSTKDGMAVLFHDAYIKKADNSMCKINEMTYEELKKMDCKLTKLEDVFPLIRQWDKVINLDIKDIDSIESMIDTVKKNGMDKQVIVTGCNKDMVHRIKSYDSKMQVFLNIGSEYIRFKDLSYEEFVQKIYEDVIECSCCGINVNFNDCTKELIEYMRLRSLSVFVWTVDNEKDMKKYINMGVDSITTKQVVMLMNLKQARSII